MPSATKFALRSVARRYEALSEEIAELDAHLDRLVAQAAPGLVSLPGIGTDNAATLLIVAGDNPQRLRSEASFASLCGVSPIRRKAHRRGQEQARDHPLPQALHSQRGLPRADLLRLPYLANRSKGRSPHRRWEQRRLTIGASLQ